MILEERQSLSSTYFILLTTGGVKSPFIPQSTGELGGALAPLKINLPLPLVKGKGIKGIGLY